MILPSQPREVIGYILTQSCIQSLILTVAACFLIQFFFSFRLSHRKDITRGCLAPLLKRRMLSSLLPECLYQHRSVLTLMSTPPLGSNKSVRSVLLRIDDRWPARPSIVFEPCLISSGRARIPLWVSSASGSGEQSFSAAGYRNFLTPCAVFSPSYIQHRSQLLCLRLSYLIMTVCSGCRLLEWAKEVLLSYLDLPGSGTI